MNKFKRFVSLVLVLCMVMAFVPAGVSAASDDPFLRVYHLDCGRKFFQVADVEELIDVLSENGYTHLELALGNDGLRLILDDMSVLSYSNEAVANGIKAGNAAYSHAGEWTEAEMDAIIDYAAERSIEIIPLINTPGHMDAILDAMESVGISGAYNGSARTVDVTNTKAVEFTQALVSKYVDYFSAKGCAYFNMGADEYANDVYTSGAMGFGHLQTEGLYDEFAAYVNGVAAIIKKAGMTPIAFNDGLYFNGDNTAFDTAIVAAYWTSGWGSYAVASAATLAVKGHKILNTNDGWYYVLGRASGTYGYTGASSAVVNTPVTDVPGSDDPTVIGAMACLWCDEPGADYTANEQNVHTLIASLAKNNADYFVTAAGEELPETSTAPRAGETEERNISVSIGGTATDTITGGEYAADKTDLEESIATVSVTTAPAQEATVSYTQVSVTCNDLISSNSTQVATGYYHKDGDNYYPVYASRAQNGNSRYDYTWYYSTDDGVTFTQIGSQTRVYSTTAPSFTVYTKSGTEAVEASTTVTFQGVTQGTTYVQVGGVYYTINVTDAPPSNALTSSSVTLEYWITNLRVTCNNATSTTISTSTDGVNTEEGVDLTTIAGASGTWPYEGTVVYWKSVRLDSANQQTTGAGDDETADGTVMTHVRYYNSAWQYKTADGIWHYFVSGDQLVAYYLQPTDVTDQITTLTKDWGFTYDNNGYGGDAGQVGLSFAVVDGSTLTPSEDDIYTNSTVIFNYWANRDIGVVAPVNNSNYEIYKITVTEGTRVTDFTSDKWSSSDGLSWEKTTNDLGTGEWFDEREVWNISEGTDPMVNGQLDNIVWSAKDTAFLILFYVRATNANLTVKYVDDSLGGALITDRGVFADQGESFYNMENTDLPAADGEIFTLSDNATLTYYNYETEKNVVQTFEKSLLNFQDIQPQYRSGAYKYVGAEIADDGKTLILHYNIDETVLDPRYVVDFGLSVSVELSNVIKNYGTDDVKSVQMMNAAYGEAVIENGVLTYTPNAILQSPAAVTLKVTNSNDTITIFNVGFIPASTMYYEEGFATYTGSWTGGSTGSGEQGLQASANADGNYGYDAKYAAETGKSNGTEAVSTASGDRAELTFTGTGIDVYANCDTTTSIMMAMLYNAEGKMVKMYQVDTKAKDGTTGATDEQAKESFSLPVVSIQGLDHGSYRLVLQHTKASSSDAELRIDGFRVYNTLTAEAYATDYAEDEKNASFLEVRNAVLAGLNVTEQTKSDLYTYVDTLMSQVYDDEQTLNGALVLGATGIDVKDLLENGPKNELFLWPGETLTFNLGGASAQIGLKAPVGATSYAIADVASGTINTATDLFYENSGFTGTIVITNTGSNILSITKLKLFGADKLQALTAEDVAYALSVMGMVEGGEPMARPGAPMVNPFCDVSEDAWFFEAVMWAVKHGITNGMSPDQFMPNSACSRAQIVTFLWRANSAPEMDGAENPFEDVTEESYYYDAVLWAYENGITNGMDATHFAPNGQCTRAQVVTFLWRANGAPEMDGAENPFSDVKSDEWYTDAVLWACENGITKGMGGDIFGVESICNRAQIVTFLYRVSKLR